MPIKIAVIVQQAKTIYYGTGCSALSVGPYGSKLQS